MRGPLQLLNSSLARKFIYIAKAFSWRIDAIVQSPWIQSVQFTYHRTEVKIVSGDSDTQESPSSSEDLNEAFVELMMNVVNNLASEMDASVEEKTRNEFAIRFVYRLMVVRFLQEADGLWTDENTDLCAATASINRSGENISESFLMKVFDELAPSDEQPTSSQAWVNAANCGFFMLDQDERDILALIPNSAWEPLLGTKGLLNQYPFALTDSASENHVTPLALGRLLERKLSDREGTGTYYTPPAIVQQMVRRSIERWAIHRCGQALPDALRAWIWGEPANDDVTSHELYPVICEAIAETTVLDPAAGSGAYLVCAADELARLRIQSGVSHNEDGQSGDATLLEIVQSSIYGVDMNEEAVMLSRIRLWLWLMHQQGHFIQMPRLNLNIVSGDSVAGSIADFSVLDYNPSHPFSAVNELLEYRQIYLDGDDEEHRSAEDSFWNTMQTIKQQAPELTEHEGVIYELQFPSIFRRSTPGFSIVLANPPYVRAENLSEAYKERLTSLFKLVSPTSDLFCAFFAKSFKLLSEGGVQAFLCSNSWMDVDYGVGLKRRLLNFTLVELLDVSRERTFRDAAVNTIISFVQNSPPAEDSYTRIVRMTDHTSYQESSENTKQFLQSEVKPDEKWSLYVQGSESFWDYDNLHAHDDFKFEQFGEITRGFTSGANDFFFIKEGAETGIEQSCLKPLIKSPKEITGLIVTPEMLSMEVFVCEDSKSDLPATAPGALAYIERAEKAKIEIKKGLRKGESLQGYHQLPTTSTRPQWYTLPKLKHSDILLRQFFDKVFDFPMNPTNILTDHTFYYISLKRSHFLSSPSERTRRLAAFLNSTIGWLLIESVGRKNMGDGVLTCYGPEFKRLRIPLLETLSEIVEPFNTLAERPVESVFDELGVDENDPKTFKTARSSTRADRRALDDAVFDVIGFDEDQRERWYTDFLEAISQRLSKAKKVL